ncbi:MULTISPECIES: hypothetical protein [unclassified Streptomyces]|uniref:hypothetical protein n=1 Tax=unclassified Streptomyces TaxID=2593676 RepID=UPI001110A648|nr:MULTISPECIES: hypothetical protein [unclassified Streptomyces]QCX76243.1 hypothetical protein C9F11_12830 [Streptomyces sp. YIM 121038]
MRHGRLALCSALGTAALTLSALALSPTATAVDPTTATLDFECGSFGSGAATLKATQNGTSATIELSTSAITAPVNVGAGAVNSTLTLTKNGTGTTTFTGRANPAIPAGSPISSGPLKGTVASGDRLSAKSLKVVVFGITVTCNATSEQKPGPFVF